MSLLQVFATDPAGPASPSLSSSDPAQIAATLAPLGIGFERWQVKAPLAPNADPAAILAAYSAEIAQVQAGGSYPTVDAIRMTPEHPDRQALRQKFLAEHIHSEDEVRFFVEGQGLFCLTSALRCCSCSVKQATGFPCQLARSTGLTWAQSPTSAPCASLTTPKAGWPSSAATQSPSAIRASTNYPHLD